MVRQKDRKKPIQLKRNATGRRREERQRVKTTFTDERMTEASKEKKRKLTEESEHEDAVIAYPQLIDIFKVISGQVFIL